VRRIILKPKSAVARHPLIICSPGWTLLKYPVVLLQRHLSNVLPTEVQDRIVRGKELRRLGLTIKGAGILATVASKEPIPHPSGQLRRDLIMVLHGEVADTATGIHPLGRERSGRTGVQATMTGATERSTDWMLRLQIKSRQHLGKEKEAAHPGDDHTAILPYEAYTSLVRPIPLKERYTA